MATPIFIFLLRHSPNIKQPPIPKQIAITSSSPIPTPDTTHKPVAPKELEIPKLGVSANVEEVGLDTQGKMDVPKVLGDVGWYDLGYVPGDKGSAVIDGHYDLASGAPSVFYYLSNLSPGDKIYVTDQDNRQYTFVVDESTAYPYNQLPLQQIFDSTDKPRLDLITCSGIWDQGTRNYSQRLVVYAELIQ